MTNLESFIAEINKHCDYSEFRQAGADIDLQLCLAIIKRQAEALGKIASVRCPHPRDSYGLFPMDIERLCNICFEKLPKGFSHNIAESSIADIEEILEKRK